MEEGECEAALWEELRSVKRALALEADVEERLALRARVGELTQRIRRVQMWGKTGHESL